MPDKVVFVVRFWREATPHDPTTWRGIVIHVPNGERTPVCSPDEAVQVMASYLDLAHVPSTVEQDFPPNPDD